MAVYGCLAPFDALASGEKRLHVNPRLLQQVPAYEVAFFSNRLRPHCVRSMMQTGWWQDGSIADRRKLRSICKT